MKDDRGELDLSRRIEELENSLSIALGINDKYQRENKEKDKLIQELRMNMRDYIIMHQQDKELLAVKIKEVDELTRDNKLLAKQVDDILNVRGARSVS